MKNKMMIIVNNVMVCKSDDEGKDASTDEKEAALDKLHQYIF